MRPFRVIVSAEGLARLVRDLDDAEEGIITHAMGVTIKAFAVPNNRFTVHLTRYQYQKLTSYLKHVTLEEHYDTEELDATSNQRRTVGTDEAG